MFFRRRPASKATVIQSLKETIPTAMGPSLVSIILHGPHAQQNVVADESIPIHVLIVIDNVHSSTLEKLASAYDLVQGSERITPMVLSPEEMRASTDVFPITFLEMKRCHQLIAGEDVLEGLQIDSSHLRLRCEQELKNLLLRMQSAYLTRHKRARDLMPKFKRDHAALARTLGAALALKSDPVARPEGARETLIEAASRFDLEQDSIERICDVAESDLANVDAVRTIYATMIQWVAEAAAAIDAIPEEVTLLEVTGEDE